MIFPIFLLLIGQSYGFMDSCKDLIIYNFSKTPITNSNCNQILDYAKTHDLYCVNVSDFKSFKDWYPLSDLQKKIYNYYVTNEKEINNLIEKLIESLDTFEKSSGSYFPQAFSYLNKKLKEFINVERDFFDFMFLNLIDRMLKNLEETIEKYPDIMDNYNFGTVHLLSKYSVYEKCHEKYYNINNLTCFILNKNYYIMRYNNFINEYIQ